MNTHVSCARTSTVCILEKGQRSTADAWILDNHAFVQFQIREIRRSLPSSYLRKLTKVDQGPFTGELRIHRLAADLVAGSSGVIDSRAIGIFAQALQAESSLCFAELWAFGSMVKLAIIQRLCGALDQEPVVSAASLQPEGFGERLVARFRGIGLGGREGFETGRGESLSAHGFCDARPVSARVREAGAAIGAL